MNPFPMVLADLRAMRSNAFMIVLLVALAVAIGVAIAAQERALRQSSARAADDFDLLIGAPGSQSQLVLTSVYLQPEALPLMDGRLLDALGRDARVAASAPLAFGDVVRGYPIIGTTAAFVTRWGRVKIAEGRAFELEKEAVVGAAVDLRVGEVVTPAHATTEDFRHPGVAGEAEAGHRHEGVEYRIVGRLPALGTPWDRAILIPIESVWEAHGLGNGHQVDDGNVGPPFDAIDIPSAPAIVVKPRNVPDAYALRAQYRQGGTMALFPAEVLVSLYQTIGDIRDALVVASALNNLLILMAVLLLMVTVVGMRERRYAVLRALGASRTYVLLVVWIGAAALVSAGCVAGLLLGWLSAYGLAAFLEGRTGLLMPVTIGETELYFTALLVIAASVLALIPAALVYRGSVSQALRV